MTGVEIRFDPALVEEAVFLELKRREASGDRHMAEAFLSQRSSLYGAAPPAVEGSVAWAGCRPAWGVGGGVPRAYSWGSTGAADEREARFQQLAARSFHELGLAELVTKRFEECPLVAAHVQMAMVQRVWSRKEERVELYVRPATHGRVSIEASTTLLLALQAARYLNRDDLAAFLRHELMHVSDMLDPAFAYEPHPAFGGECDTEDDLIRERLRLLWDLFVEDRMRRRGWQTVMEESTRRREFERMFAPWEPERREAVWRDFGSRESWTQRELLELAQDERLTRMLGQGGIRCPLCHFPTREGVHDWSNEHAAVVEAIRTDYPAWEPSHGACLQCVELYRSRRQLA